MPPVSPDRWKRLDALFEAALDVPATEQRAFLQEAASDDPSLVDEVMELLAEAPSAGAFLGESVTGWAPDLVEAALGHLDESDAPERVGPYRVLHELGRGGMGTVYLARRDDGVYAKEVALKVVRRGMDTDDVLHRFRHERQILARLEHPHIARLLDGGRTDDGRPYLVMDYVAGVRLDHYCRRKALPRTARLRLFQQVARAVHHAHRNLVVHRDLKPSNILVTDDGTVKLLDFGIAKVLADEEPGAPRTRTQHRLLTPEYASPEQRHGGPITTATDIYALGVLLHELLTGVRPGQPSDALRGELALIVRKALAEDPDARYTSAEALAEDLDRHLGGLPVQARPASVPYRVRKFVHRHRKGVAATAAVVLMLVALATFYTVRLTEARNAAQVEAARAQATVAFLETLFEEADPDALRGDTLTVFDLLDRGAGRLDRLDSQPATQARLRQTLGHLFLQLGDYDAAESHLQAAHQTLQQLPTVTPADQAEALHRLGQLALKRARYPAADSFFQASLALRRQAADPLATARTLNDYGYMLATSGQYDDALSRFDDALRLLDQQPGDVREAQAMSRFGQASVHMNEARHDQAESLYLQVLETRRALYGPVHSEVAAVLNDLGNLYAETRRLPAADSLLREALDIRRQLYGDDHPEVSLGLNNLAYLLFEQGDFAGAEAMFVEAMGIKERLEGRENRDVALTLSNIGWTRQNQGDMAGAEAAFREALGIMQRTVGPESADAALVLGNVAWTLQQQGRLAEAEPFYREALAVRRVVHGDSNMHVAWRQFALAEVIRMQGRYTEAEALHRASLSLRQALRAPGHYDIGRGLSGLGHTLLDQTRYAEAEALHREAVTLFAALPDSFNLAVSHGLLGAALAGQDRATEARSALETALALYDAVGARQHPRAEEARDRLAALSPASGGT